MTTKANRIEMFHVALISWVEALRKDPKRKGEASSREEELNHYFNELIGTKPTAAEIAIIGQLVSLAFRIGHSVGVDLGTSMERNNNERLKAS